MFISDEWKLSNDSDGVQIYIHPSESESDIVLLKRNMIVNGTPTFVAAVLQDLEDIEETSKLIEK